MEDNVEDTEHALQTPQERLKEVKELWDLSGEIGPLDVDWLISQAAFADELNKAGERMKNAAVAYIQELERTIDQRQARIDGLELELKETTK